MRLIITWRSLYNRKNDKLISNLIERYAMGDRCADLVEDAGAYGRIVKDEDGRILKIVEARDASEAELAIGEYNTGVFCFKTDLLIEAVDNLTTDNQQGEYYLTDTVAYLVGAGYPVEAVATNDPDEVVGINTVDELAEAEQLLARRGE